MSIFWLSSIVILWGVVLLLGFLLLGTLRALGLLTWRLAQLEATTPKRLGRDGLKPGKKAPDFTLPCVTSPPNPPLRFGDGGKGGEVSLHDFTDGKVLLVFTQSGCSPCQKIVPELNRLENGGDCQVVVVNNGDAESTRKWSAEVGARFPVLAQTQFIISKKYEVFATPFAFLIDEKGVIASKGIINNRQHIGYVLSGKRVGESNGRPEVESDGADNSESKEFPISTSKEVSHV